MKTYPVGVNVTVTIPLIDLNGDPVTPTGLTYVVRDETGTEIVPATELAVTEGMTDAAIVVPVDKNGLPEGALSGMRIVSLTIQTAQGAIPAETAYVLRLAQRLVVLENSFQTYMSAWLLAADTPNLFGWNAAEELAQHSAMIEAYSRLTRLGYRVRRAQDIDWQNTVGEINDIEDLIEPRAWPVMELSRWNRLPEHFRKALARAQLLEANEILRGDVVGDKRRSGLMSESIGESSMMFRPGKPLNFGISSAALEALSGYVAIRMTLTRS